MQVSASEGSVVCDLLPEHEFSSIQFASKVCIQISQSGRFNKVANSLGHEQTVCVAWKGMTVIHLSFVSL